MNWVIGRELNDQATHDDAGSPQEDQRSSLGRPIQQGFVSWQAAEASSLVAWGEDSTATLNPKPLVSGHNALPLSYAANGHT